MAIASLDELIDEDWEWRLCDLPEFATATGDHRYDDRLDDRSLAAYERRIQFSKGILARVDAWERRYGSGGDAPGEKTPPQDLLNARVSARLLAHHSRSVCEGGLFRTYLCPINRLEGPHTELPQLVEYMKFETASDYKKYVARLRAIPRALSQVESVSYTHLTLPTICSV